MDGATVAALHQAISDAASGAPRVLVLTGADGHFCAGADITTTEDPDYTIGLRAMLDALAGLAFPTIAAIEGSCMGLGVQLALSVDLRVAAEDVRFAVPVARLGLLTDHRTLQRLALAVGWGMARSMVENLVTGVTTGFRKELEIQGVGYRAAMQGNVLKLSLGYSHEVNFDVPTGVTVTSPKQTEIVVEGIDQQLVGQVAANIRDWKRPEPYKGKGIRYKDEFVFRKEGKKK